MNGPWSDTASAWVDYQASWQPIVTSVRVGVATASLSLRPATAGGWTAVAAGTVGLVAAIAPAQAAATASVAAGAASLALDVRPAEPGAATTAAPDAPVALGLGILPAQGVPRADIPAAPGSLELVPLASGIDLAVEAPTAALGLALVALPATVVRIAIRGVFRCVSPLPSGCRLASPLALDCRLPSPITASMRFDMPSTIDRIRE